MSSIEKNKEFNTTFFSEPKTRRSAIKSIASGMTIAALSGCANIRKPYRKIKAYNNDQENLIPGIPNYYATSIEINGDVNGLIVASHEGRPVKIDGNPSHLQNAGKSNQFIQAEILSLYDPDRIQNNFNNQSKKLSIEKIKNELSNLKQDSTMAIVMPNSFSLIERNLLKELKSQSSKIQFFNIDHTTKENQLSSIKDLTNKSGYLHLNFKPTKFIVSFNHDFLGLESSQLRQSYNFVSSKNKFRFVSYSDSLTTTDSKADSIVNSSLLEQAHTIRYIAKNIARKFPKTNVSIKLANLQYNKNLIDRRKAYKIIQQLRRYKGLSIFSVGESHSIETQKIVLLLNNLLGNIGKTILINSFADDFSNFYKSNNTSQNIDSLKEQLTENKIKTIISLGVDLTRHIAKFKEIAKDTNIISLSKYKNELTNLSNITISQTHFLEEWGLLVSKEGDLLIQQPLINPLYGSVSTSDILLALIKNNSISVFKYLQFLLKKNGVNFNSLKAKGVFEKFKRQRKLSIKTSSLTNEDISNEEATLLLSIPFSHTMLDGRYSNNAWLQESPDPITKLTWGNAFQISSDFGKVNDLKTGDVISITTESKKIVKGPVIILPGQNSNTITVPYGYGNIFSGAFSNHGISTDQFIPNNAYKIEKIKKLKETVTLADTQMNHGLDEEELAASGIKNRIKNILKIQTIQDLHKPDKHKTHEPHSLFKELKYKGKYQWGMSIDLNSCLGCNACSIACQSENNIPIVGKEEVIRGREMSWLRIDRYFIENKNNETTINFMPVACVHCENAPCEQVCPVNATVHDDEGLNVMTYNRCVGTRYCANNCPYKVRRFNFFDWHQKNPQSVKKERIHLFDYFKEPVKQQQMQFNPEVTVRMRGVMEKCTYCLQRIKNSKINAKVNNDESYIKKLETACQQACSTNSIVFGNINDKSAEVSKNRKNKRRYDLLQYELNTKPRTIYLSKIVNPLFKPKLKKEKRNGHS